MRKYYTLFLTLYFLTLMSQNYSTSSIPDSLKLHANALIRDENTEVFLHSKTAMEVYYTKTITVFNKKGRLKAFPCVYYDESTKVNSFTVSIYNQYGALIKEIKSKDIQDESAVSDWQLYTDNRVKYYDYVPTSYPYTISYQYHTQSKNTLLLEDWKVLDDFNVSVENNKYTLHNPQQLKIRYKKRNLSQLKIVKEETPTLLSFVLENPVKAIEKEPYAPAFQKLIPKVQIAPDEFHHEKTYGKTGDWQNFGNWVHQLIRERNDLPETTKSKIRTLTEGLSKREKVKKLYEYMQNKTRYIYVGIGIGGLQPFSAKEVDQLGYGDCKGLTNYMKNLLDAVAIPSYYTVIYGDANHKINIQEDFTDFEGNHVVLCVPIDNDTIWLENTSQKSPFNFLGDFTFDRKALLIDEKSSKIIRTQQFPIENNIQEVKAKIHFVNNTAKIKATRISKGLEYDQVYFLDDLNSEKKKAIYKNHFDKIKNIKINTIDLHNDKDRIIYTENLDLEFPNSINTQQKTIIFNPNLLIHHPKLKKDYDRKFPMEIDWGFINTAEYEIQLPPHFQLDNLPEVQEISSEFGEYHLIFEQKEGKIILKRYYKLFQNNYPPEKYNDFVDFNKKIRKADKTLLILNKI